MSPLEAGEKALRAGQRKRAIQIFRRIVERYSPSLDSLAALAYLRSAGVEEQGMRD